MPSNVQQVFAAAGIRPDGPVAWGASVPETDAGVYVIALTDNTQSLEATQPDCPLSQSALEMLLRVRPALLVDGTRPDASALAQRLSAFWLRDEVVLYVGLAGTSVHDRVNAYYGTRIGARSPHAGGWFLRMLSVLQQLHVHYAATDEPALAENHMLATFNAQVSDTTRSTLHDPDRPIPFANIEWPKRRYKRHGITGAKQPRAPRARAQSGATTPPAAARLSHATDEELAATRTQRVTAADLAAGRVRIPRGATKSLLPRVRQDIDIVLRGEPLTCKWNPRTGPDQERSGVLSVGRHLLPRLVAVNEVLDVSLRGGIPHLG